MFATHRPSAIIPACATAALFRAYPRPLQDGDYAPSSGAAELQFCSGEVSGLRGKVVYFVRASAERPVDLDKVRWPPALSLKLGCACNLARGALVGWSLHLRRCPRPSQCPPASRGGIPREDRGGRDVARIRCSAHAADPPPSLLLPQASDGALLFGEVTDNVLPSLTTSLGDLFTVHSSERTEWGKADPTVRGDLQAELERVSAALHDALAACSEGLALAAAPGDVDLDEALRTTTQRTKSKKAAIDSALVAQLQGL